MTGTRMGWQWAYLRHRVHLNTLPVPKADALASVIRAYGALPLASNPDFAPGSLPQPPENLLTPAAWIKGWETSLRPPVDPWP